MIYLIIGHRGVGKTLWLKKIKKIFKNKSITLDLDQEIIKKHTKFKNILHPMVSSSAANQHFFKHQEVFRKVEQSILKNLIHKYSATKNNIFIAVGAGAKIKPLAACYIVHLIRETDPNGRIFLDRPRLTKYVSAYKEALSLYPSREQLYQNLCDDSFILPEQDPGFSAPEKVFFGLKNTSLNACITLNKHTLPKDSNKWKMFISKRLKWGLNFFEFRDDEWNFKSLHKTKQGKILLKIIPEDQKLFSFRKKKASGIKDISLHHWDWALENGVPPGIPTILSIHQRGKKTLTQVCKKLLSYKGKHYKLAIPIKNLRELLKGHEWFLQNPKKRSFLPISNSLILNWKWYREIFGPKMKLNFIRESYKYGLPDQIPLYAAINKNKLAKPDKIKFGAVIGMPFSHSASPSFYRKLFTNNKMVFTKINLSEKDFTKQNFYILQNLGLIFSAVTSPLKQLAVSLCDKLDSTAKELQAVNTLILHKQKWLGYNTDLYGAKILLQHAGLNKIFQPEEVAVWGGGGTKNILKYLLPPANFYSVRAKHKYKNPSAPKVIIWACGRRYQLSSLLPFEHWKPKLVIDLNYTMDSPGREYALLSGAQYIPGKKMFLAQAKKQKELLLKYLKVV